MSTTRVVKYPFTSFESSQDPIPLWKGILADGPVTRTRIIFFNKLWLATTWEAANEVLKDQERFGRESGRVGKTATAGLQWWMPKTLTRLTNNMLNFDKEKHRRLRGLVDQAFRRRQIEQMRPTIERITSQFLDQFEKEVHRSSTKSADIVSILCRQLPLAIICEVLGLPDEDRPKFTKWFRGFSEFSNLFSIVKIVPSLLKTVRYLEEQFDILRNDPRPGLLNDLVQAQAEGDQLSHDELVATAFILLVAGHETTVHLLSNGILMLIQNPEQRQRLEQNWSN
ncbi:MAG: cytochrome P450, partial [Planctomycetota bacterium]